MRRFETMQQISTGGRGAARYLPASVACEFAEGTLYHSTLLAERKHTSTSTPEQSQPPRNSASLPPCIQKPARLRLRMEACMGA